MTHAAAALGFDSSLATHYEESGYAVAEQIVPPALIDELLRTYARDIVTSKKRFFRQSTNLYERNRLSACGFVEQSFLDIHAYKSYPAFRAAALEIFFSAGVQETLESITGSAAHNLMQSMLFDANTATEPHQDWWYLDSVPNGRLIAAWIAMEDIHEDAGRFFIIPGTHRVTLHDAEKTMPHSEWLERVKRYFDAHRAEVFAPALRKGDVLFWNSRTIHGALQTMDHRRSRKSLTAHFLPSEMQFGNLFTAKPWIKYEREGDHRYFANQPEYSLKSAMVSTIKVALYDHPQLLRLARRFQRGGVSDY